MSVDEASRPAAVAPILPFGLPVATERAEWVMLQGNDLTKRETGRNISSIYWPYPISYSRSDRRFYSVTTASPRIRRQRCI